MSAEKKTDLLATIAWLLNHISVSDPKLDQTFVISYSGCSSDRLTQDKAEFEENFYS